MVLAPAGEVEGARAGAEWDKDALHCFSWEGFRTGGNVTHCVPETVR